MKRNRHGVNLDAGVALHTEWELKNLYAPCHEETFRRLTGWMRQDDSPLLFGGQIGCGKSSFILKTFMETEVKPDITLHLDREGLDLSLGDFWRIVLSEFCKCALFHDVDLSIFTLPKELAGLSGDDWRGLLDKLSPRGFSMDSYDERLRISGILADNSPYIRDVIDAMGNGIKEKIGRSLLIFASGVDKYATGTAAYFSLAPVLEALLLHKTLFEVNAVHLFNCPRELSTVEKLFLPSMTDQEILDVLYKRMGIYTEAVKDELAVLGNWVGGNPRQAIRLLAHFEAAKKNRNNGILDSISHATRSTARDFFAFGERPGSEIMRYVNVNREIEASEFTLPGDRDTARLALFGNWFFITGDTRNGAWPAMVNPLVKDVFDWEITPEEPEIEALRLYAEARGVSSVGLSFQVTSDTGEKESGEKLFNDFFLQDMERPLSTNLSEVIEIMAAALLSRDRSDRVIIAYKDASVLDATRAYLSARANSYEYQRCSHTIITGGEGMSPLPEFLAFLVEDTDIFSIHLQGNWTTGQLQSLDKLRDRLTRLQMIWWVEYDHLSLFLREWVHLRQLFQLFILEDELLGSLSMEEIKGDMAFLEDMVEDEDGAEANVIRNLRLVLDYLEKAKGGENG